MSYINERINIYIKVHLGAGGSHRVFTEKKWRSAVRTGKTRLGYSEWVASSITADLLPTPTQTFVSVAAVPSAPIGWKPPTPFT